jgi:hypothetical protein
MVVIKQVGLISATTIEMMFKPLYVQTKLNGGESKKKV